MTARENVFLALLIVSVGGNVALLIAGGDDDPAPAPQTQALPTTTGEEESTTPTAPPVTERTEPVEPATTEPTGGAEAPADEEAGAGRPPLCREIDVPDQPPEPITCRTASAILTIVGEARPLLLGDTHVRVQSASLAQNRLTLRVRVRNETDAEQGIQAGGQELYLNLNGIRVDRSR
jgi:hypothetical protein